MSRYTIASVSCGKDSIVIPYECIRRNLRLDEVIMYDTGMEFQAIYNEWAALVKLLDKNGIKHTVLHPEYSFCWQMFERPVNVGKENEHLGYSWCGGTCRWGTADKRTILGKYAEDRDAIVLVGIAADEPERQEKEFKPYKRFPLIEWKMTEADCLAYCYEKGYDWGGLYRHFKRVSCWCCPLQSLDELRQLYKYFPSLWQKLREWDGRTWRGFRKDYNVRELEVRFDFEDECREKGMPIKGKAFFFNFRKRLEEMDMDNRMQMVDIGKLVPYVNNARTHSAAQISKLRASIREFGFINPVIIDGDYGIIAGHGRVVAAQEEGLAEVPCVLVDHLTEAQKKAYILADNRYAQDAGWDEEMLRIEIEGLQGMDFDVSLTGFRDDEITDLFALKDDGVDDPTGNNKEFGEEEFGDEEFEHECPRCGFHFNGSGRNSSGVGREADNDGEE